MNELTGLKAALAFSVAAIASEHFFSAGMSSPWSVSKFATTDTDRRQVWKLFAYGSIASLVFAVIVGAMLNGGRAIMYAVIGSAAVSAFMAVEYKQALDKTL